MKRILTVLVLALATAAAVHAAPITPFTAHYDVLRSGSRIGTATMTLAAHGATWQFTTETRATDGVAALLGLDVSETSTFRWHGAAPELVSYDYQLKSGVKSASRHMAADWQKHIVRVADSRHGNSQYATQPALVERHLATLALILALRDGKTDVALPVAVRDRVEAQRYRVADHGAVKVPAGSFANAAHVVRVDAEHPFEAWFVPDRYAVPVQLRQGKKFELQLVDYAANAAPAAH